MLTAVWNGAIPWSETTKTLLPGRPRPRSDHRPISLLIGDFEVGRVPGDLGLILAGADGVGVAWIARLPAVGQRELMAGAIRLLDVDHHEIGVGILAGSRARQPGSDTARRS